MLSRVFLGHKCLVSSTGLIREFSLATIRDSSRADVSSLILMIRVNPVFSDKGLMFET